MGFPPITHSPAVLGSDISGTVISSGSEVPPGLFPAGTRVTGFAPCFFKQGEPQYGAFQEKVLVPYQLVCPIPWGVGWNEAASLGMSVITAWSGWWVIGLLSRELKVEVEESTNKGGQKGILVWGGSSSIGTGAIQSAKLMGFKVYTTSSPHNHAYLLSTLNADRVFDYKDPDVVSFIIKAAQEDGISISIAYDAAGATDSCTAILNALTPPGEQGRIASAVGLKGRVSEMVMEGGAVAKFVVAPEEEKDRDQFFEWVFNRWLKEKLEKGEYVPSPRVRVVEGGLAGLNGALDELKKGVSGVKLVVEVKK